MSATMPLEEQILSPSAQLLNRLAPTPDARIEVLEAVASLLGGFTLHEYRRRFDATGILTEKQALEAASSVLCVLKRCLIPPSLALCALARPRVSHARQRVSGAYYTDFRLAQYVVAPVAKRLVPGARVIDPAAGTGILLVAASLIASGPDRLRRARWLAECVTAWDLSVDALRGARLALASLTNDLSAVETMVGRWNTHDSLLAETAAWGEYDVVLGNPPWEKIKLSRHEFAKANGIARHYGAEYERFDDEALVSQRGGIARYGSALAHRYPLLGRGEPDLYKAFLELFLKLVSAGGCVSVLVPAGLIRSQGTAELRGFLVEHAGELCFTILENRARFFAIDTRFKFLGLVFTKSGGSSTRDDLRVQHATGTAEGVVETGRARIGRKALRSIRPDLTVPEVRSAKEWRLFRAMSMLAPSAVKRGSPWECEIVREVDMTRDRKDFLRSPGSSCIPLIEGRMVHQHRFGAKAYRSGTGRKATWDPVLLKRNELTPQFWYPRHRLPDSIARRSSTLRAGFCDITGQTNERSMLAALIPSGVVCGNKVPTVTFPNDPRENRLLLWLAVANSFTFDWALRRIVTTTVNYFVLKSVPFPRLQPDSLPGRRLVEASRELRCIDSEGNAPDVWRTAELRASIDIAVHAAYGLGFEDLALILRDFPLLDRGQPPLEREERSTVTRDFILAQASRRFRVQSGRYLERVTAARAAGAVPYIPSEFLSGEIDSAAGASDV